jgi:hypothetical protein
MRGQMTRRSDAWPAYIAIATVGYVVFGLGGGSTTG